MLEDLKAGKAGEIRGAIEDGKTFLCICGGFQMLGHYYETADGVKCEFLGAVDLYTKADESAARMIDNYAFRLGEESGGSTVVDFENHSGKTFLGEGIRPLGTILKGFGNNGQDGTEGVRYRNVFGTYSHGPVLPKNPALCDEILRAALVRKYGAADLSPLDDAEEMAAHESALEMILKNQRTT